MARESPHLTNFLKAEGFQDRRQIRPQDLPDFTAADSHSYKSIPKTSD